MHGDPKLTGDGSSQMFNNGANEQSIKNKQLISATFYDGVKMKEKNNGDPSWGTNKPGIAVYEYKDGKKLAFASQGFNSLWSDLKPGLTLDKIFGGNFKKIALEPENIKEFEKSDAFSSNSAAPKSNDAFETRSRPKDENLEIENANDLNNSRNDISVGRVTRTRISDFNYNGKHQAESNGKNENKTPQMRSNGQKMQQSPLRAQNKYVNSQAVADKYDQNTEPDATKEHSRAEHIRGQPYENYRNYPKPNPEPRSLSVNANPKNKEKDRNKEAQRANAEQFQGSRQNFYKNAQETQTQFRVSGNGFRKSFHQQQGKDEGSAYQKKMNAYNYEQPSYINNDRKMKPGMKQYENYEYGDEFDSNRPTSRLQATQEQEAARMRNTGARFYPEKEERQNFPYKGVNETNYIAERIERHEQEMLNKYSSRQLLNKDEGTTVKPQIVSEMVGKRRLSTPIRDFYSDSPFGSKNFAGKVEKSII